MALTSRLLARGTGWRVEDMICTSGPRDRPFEERHNGVCIGAVTHGTFRYRSALGSAVFSPGALVLGNHCHCFECSHDHAAGDRCLSFRFAPEFFESVLGAVPGARTMSFAVPRLPPNPALLPVIAAAEAARDAGDAGAFEEVALRVAGGVATAFAGSSRRVTAPSDRDEKRISAALRLIEAQADDALSVAELARVTAMSPYHFLRTFRVVVGMTPHQFILHTRLHRAAVGLRRTSENVSAIAFAAGFGDLSTFNRRFARIFGLSPSAYRARAQTVHAQTLLRAQRR